MNDIKPNASGWGMKWPAPAKLNLLLLITGQRADGYHLLQTVFQFIELCDWLTFEPTENSRVYLKQTIPGVSEEEDLTIKAAKLLQAETACKLGVCIDVEKHLPMGGGLGGGSSDAATTLVTLNHLWGLGLSVEKLMQLGVTLGADVPVFVFGQSAWAEGVGEHLQQINLPEQWFVVIKPDCHVVTKDVFCEENLTRDSDSITIVEFMAGHIKNDCQEVVLNLYPPVADAWEELSKYGDARLTGTGACVFAEFESESEARYAYAMLQKNWEVYLAPGLNESPLRKQLAKLS